MNLAEAHKLIWDGKFPPNRPENEHIDRVNWTAGMFPDLPGGSLLVDFGTGSGQMLYEAKRRGWKSIGYENDGRICEWLSSMGNDVRQVDLSTAILDANDTADIVTCCDVIEHLIDPLHAMREAWAILKRGGRLYVGTPNLSCWRRIKTLISGVHPRTSGDKVLLDGGHVGYYGPGNLMELLNQAGFGSAKILYFNPDPMPKEYESPLRELAGNSQWLGYTYMIAAAVK